MMTCSVRCGRGCIPRARRGRRRRLPPAAPCRSRVPRAPGARCRGCSASLPIGAARGRGCIPPARRGRRRRASSSACGAALAYAERHERVAEIVLRHCPDERHALAGVFLERGAVGDDGFLQPRGAAFALAERHERVAEVVLRHCPVERHALAGAFLERGAVGGDGFLQPRRAASRWPSVRSARPRLFCVVAHWSGTRSRVRSSSAAR